MNNQWDSTKIVSDMYPGFDSVAASVHAVWVLNKRCYRARSWSTAFVIAWQWVFQWILVHELRPRKSSVQA